MSAQSLPLRHVKSGFIHSLILIRKIYRDMSPYLHATRDSFAYRNSHEMMLQHPNKVLQWYALPRGLDEPVHTAHSTRLIVT